MNGGTSSWLEPSARNAYRIVILAGLILVLALNLPGHLSFDSIVAFYQGRTGVRQTWAPAIFPWILGRFDALLDGAGLYVAASAALLFFVLGALPRLRRRMTWLAPLLAAAAVATPQLLVYQGIVWRDVLFANLVVAAFVLLAFAVQGWRKRPALAPALGALACLATAMLVRENGIVVVAVAAVALGLAARTTGWRSRLAWGLGGLVLVIALAFGLNLAVQPQQTVKKLRANAAARILEHADIVGAKAHDPSLALDAVARANPKAPGVIAEGARISYSPERIDGLDRNETLRKTLWRLPDAAVAEQWRTVLIEHPDAYFAHRADTFQYVFLTPQIDHCLPVHVGVEGPPNLIAELRMKPGAEARDRALADYARRFYATPVFSHLSYAVIALVVAGALLLRRDPADWAIIGLQVAALAFAATFFVIAVACDYRYLYPLDLAAIAGALYLALDPPLPARRQRASSASRAP